jgi:5-methylthioadenosine/S-adenosylhomocysteine deaminase
VRNVEYETFKKTKKKSVYQSALPLKNDAAYGEQVDHMKAKNAFIYHLSEGTDPALIKEYNLARTEKILRPRFCAIHCTALGAPQFKEWGQKVAEIDGAEDVPGERNGTIIWSPFSNLWLYRATTHVESAMGEGMRICLGSDWSPSGSKNLLGELKVADLWNRTKMGNTFSAEALCAMATRNPADAIGWSDLIGRLKEGLHADVLVTTDRGGDPYRNLIESRERDVQFVAINGQPFYGTQKLMNAAGQSDAEPIKVGTLSRRIKLVYKDIKDADMKWADVVPDLIEATADPVKRYLEIEHLHQVGKPPPWLKTDKPWDDPDVTGKPIPVTVRIPPLDSLTHDAAFFKAVKKAKLHGGLLDGVRDYYSS